MTPLRRRLLAATLGLGLALGLFVAGANAVVLAHGRRGVYGSPGEAPPRAVAIVLGAHVHRNGTPSDALEDRLAAALALYRAGRVRRILVTGDNGTRHYDEVTVMQRWLVARGVPRDHVVRDHAGFRTLDSMVRAARVFRVRHAVVCTQRFHMARSLFLARHAGLDAVGVVADGRVYVARRRDAAREVLARAVAVLDAWVLRRGPRFLGPEIPLEDAA